MNVTSRSWIFKCWPEKALKGYFPFPTKTNQLTRVAPSEPGWDIPYLRDSPPPLLLVSPRPERPFSSKVPDLNGNAGCPPNVRRQCGSVGAPSEGQRSLTLIVGNKRRATSSRPGATALADTFGARKVTAGHRKEERGRHEPSPARDQHRKFTLVRVAAGADEGPSLLQAPGELFAICPFARAVWMDHSIAPPVSSLLLAAAELAREGRPVH